MGTLVKEAASTCFRNRLVNEFRESHSFSGFDLDALTRPGKLTKCWQAKQILRCTQREACRRSLLERTHSCPAVSRPPETHRLVL